MELRIGNHCFRFDVSAAAQTGAILAALALGLWRHDSTQERRLLRLEDQAATVERDIAAINQGQSRLLVEQARIEAHLARIEGAVLGEKSLDLPDAAKRGNPKGELAAQQPRKPKGVVTQ